MLDTYLHTSQFFLSEDTVTMISDDTVTMIGDDTVTRYRIGDDT